MATSCLGKVEISGFRARSGRYGDFVADSVVVLALLLLGDVGGIGDVGDPGDGGNPSLRVFQSSKDPFVVGLMSCVALPPPHRLLVPVFGRELGAGWKISTVSFSINSALAVATIMLLGGGGVIESK